MKQAVTTDNAPGTPNLLSQAIISNGNIYVAGQIHMTTERQLVDGSTEEKLAQIMKNLGAILNAAGAGFDNVVKLTLYVTDIAELSELNKFYPAYFNAPLPAREAVCVKALPLGASIEISLIAAL